MRPIDSIAKVGSDASPAKPVTGAASSNVASASASAAQAADSASLSQAAVAVSRMRAVAGSQGGIRPDVVAQLKRDISLGHNDRKADIERAILRLLQEL